MDDKLVEYLLRDHEDDDDDEGRKRVEGGGKVNGKRNVSFQIIFCLSYVFDDLFKNALLFQFNFSLVAWLM